MNKRTHYLLATLILIAFIGVTEYYVGWRTLLAPWQSLSMAALSGAVAAVILTYWLRAMRIYDYFRDETRSRFGACLKLTLLHNFLNVMLPMRSGEVSFPVLMSRYFDVPAVRSVPVLLWFRLLDLHALGALALLAAGGSILQPPLLGMAMAVWLPMPWLAFRLLNTGAARLPVLLQGRMLAFAQSAVSGLPVTAGAFWRAWAWTLVNWAVKLAIFAWVLQLFAEMSPGAAWLGAITGDLSSVLPVHGIAGAGTYEAGVVAGLLPFGIAADVALQAAVNLHLFMLGTTAIGGAMSLFLQGRRHG